MSAETYRYEHYDPEGNSNPHGSSNLNGTSPASVTICGTRLGGEHWWWLR